MPSKTKASRSSLGPYSFVSEAVKGWIFQNGVYCCKLQWNDGILVMIKDELYILAGTAASHADEVRQTHSMYYHHFEPNC